jgi:hypothetical protein
MRLIEIVTTDIAKISLIEIIPNASTGSAYLHERRLSLLIENIYQINELFLVIVTGQVLCYLQDGQRDGSE